MNKINVEQLFKQIYTLGVYLAPTFDNEPIYEDFKDFYGNTRITIGCDNDLG